MVIACSIFRLFRIKQLNASFFERQKVTCYKIARQHRNRDKSFNKTFFQPALISSKSFVFANLAKKNTNFCQTLLELQN